MVVTTKGGERKRGGEGEGERGERGGRAKRTLCAIVSMEWNLSGRGTSYSKSAFAYGEQSRLSEKKKEAQPLMRQCPTQIKSNWADGGKGANLDSHHSPVFTLSRDGQLVNLALSSLKRFGSCGVECELRFSKIIQVLDRFGLRQATLHKNRG